MLILLAYVARPATSDQVIGVITTTTLQGNDVIDLVCHITTVSTGVTISLQYPHSKLLPPVVSA